MGNADTIQTCTNLHHTRLSADGAPISRNTPPPSPLPPSPRFPLPPPPPLLHFFHLFLPLLPLPLPLPPPTCHLGHPIFGREPSHVYIDVHIIFMYYAHEHRVSVIIQYVRTYKYITVDWEMHINYTYIHVRMYSHSGTSLLWTPKKMCPH